MYDVIVIGGGPAGIMASIIASKRGLKTLLLEKNDSLGKKLLITGGGRCNLTNLKDNNTFISKLSVNNKFMYSSISAFGPTEIYNYFNSHNCMLKTEDDDRVFPVSNRSNDILLTLLYELEKYKVESFFIELYELLSIQSFMTNCFQSFSAI